MEMQEGLLQTMMTEKTESLMVQEMVYIHMYILWIHLLKNTKEWLRASTKSHVLCLWRLISITGCSLGLDKQMAHLIKRWNIQIQMHCGFTIPRRKNMLKRFFMILSLISLTLDKATQMAEFFKIDSTKLIWV